MSRRRPPRAWPIAAAALALGLGGVAAQAQYKVVGPDGKVTYSDRPPASGQPGKVSRLGARGAETDDAAAAPLPAELRTVAARYPVTLYTARDCGDCDEGRSLLLQRGIPYTERTVEPGEDAAALQRLTGAAEVPTLAIGAQVLRGLNRGAWAQYLDLAGYPASSRLPAGWRPPAPAPLAERKPAALQRSAVVPPIVETTPPAPAESAGSGFRF